MTAAAPSDVMLLLEGTYPFVRGGVSSWVHELVQALPELSFSLCFLGARREDHPKPRYALPSNVRELRCFYLFDPPPGDRPRMTRGDARAFADADRLHATLRAGAAPDAELMRRMADHLGPSGPLAGASFRHSELAWERISHAFAAHADDPSFLDYFWTVRSIHGPALSLARFARELPPARVYHTISTGYAGFLGALLHHLHGRPLITTEHGIYTKERSIDLASAEWIREPRGGDPDSVGHLRDLWIRFYEGLGRMTYAASDPIVSLYEGNRARQIKDGAPAARTRVIPNGIDVERFRPLLARRPRETPKVVGLLGRVVAIKDIKTFVRAMRLVCDRLPDAEGWIIGPTEEDERYARECRELVDMLQLRGKVRFLGFQRPERILPRLGLLALTSISEALPLVVLEAFASGVPVVASDVGACRELIEGREGEDRALGSGGAVFPISAPEATADAILGLLADPARWRAGQAAGLARVERYYARGTMVQAYRSVYRSALEWRG